MRITFVLPHAGLSGGVRVVATYAQRLMRRGHQVCVVSTARPRRSLPARLVAWLKGRGPLRPPRHDPSHLDGTGVEHRVIARGPVTDADVPDADVVVATWWRTAEAVARLAPSKGAKAYFIQHYEVHMKQPPEQVDATWRLPMHKITISRWLAELAQGKFQDQQVSLVLNSVDQEQFNAAPRGKQPVPTVGLLYSTPSFKGCDVSFRALELASRALSGRLRVVAFSSEPVSASLPLPANTHYTYRPPQDRLKDLYGQCDVWLCGSRSEGFHLPPLEAMACRCPVVSTRVGGPMDVIEEGVNGHLLEVEDSAGLAQKLLGVLTLPEDRWRAMSEAAYATATRYTWDDATTRFEAALKKAIERTARGELGGASRPAALGV